MSAGGRCSPDCCASCRGLLAAARSCCSPAVPDCRSITARVSQAAAGQICLASPLCDLHDLQSMQSCLRLHCADCRACCSPCCARTAQHTAISCMRWSSGNNFLLGMHAPKSTCSCTAPLYAAVLQGGVFMRCATRACLGGYSVPGHASVAEHNSHHAVWPQTHSRYSKQAQRMAVLQCMAIGAS